MYFNKNPVKSVIVSSLYLSYSELSEGKKELFYRHCFSTSFNIP